MTINEEERFWNAAWHDCWRTAIAIIRDELAKPDAFKDGHLDHMLDQMERPKRQG